ncbi:ribonuclease PH Ham1 protein [Lactobacillus selangorensis]|uniref:dITP/XTP pyrophosphatase n=1 Tax=Lactobacillus selangorensis TaxID=81857 RepID=A0A0R2FQY6_9LACO|nr:ribonuclease PH Ham1 protein [Lactobacillus selangorensis]KRN31337.1 ribonuclease PH Ham1 protein [Lactobacillus selangorensis]
MKQRDNGRENDALRPLHLQHQFLTTAEPNVLIQQGETRVLVQIAPHAAKTIQFDYRGAAAVSANQWLTQALQPAVDFETFTNGFTLRCTVLQDAGSPVTTAFNGAFWLLKLWAHDQQLDKGLRYNLVAITVGLTDDGTLVDLETDDQVTTTLQLAVSDLDAMTALTVNGTMAFDGATLNQFLYTAFQGTTELMGQFKNDYQKQTHPYDTSSIGAQTVVVATKNMGKAREFEKMFAQDGITVKTLRDFPDIPDINETGTSFEENARLKADQVAHLLQLPTLADDSGLEVDALDGRPGIFSARYAGDAHNDAANNAKLLYELSGVPDEKRGATFHTTLVFAKPDQPDADLVVNGEVRGRILGIPRGDDGFGYDPLFYEPTLKKTFAQMTPDEKNQVSHRGNAMRALEKVWRDWLKKN